MNPNTMIVRTSFGLTGTTTAAAMFGPGGESRLANSLKTQKLTEHLAALHQDLSATRHLLGVQTGYRESRTGDSIDGEWWSVITFDGEPG